MALRGWTSRCERATSSTPTRSPARWPAWNSSFTWRPPTGTSPSNRTTSCGPRWRALGNVLEAARAAGVRRVLYTSTAATVGLTADPARALTEDDFVEAAEAPYMRAKIEAERAARAATVLDVVILNPSGVFGPRDYRITPSSRAIVGALQGDPMFLHFCVTDVRDVASAHVLAATKGQEGAPLHHDGQRSRAEGDGGALRDARRDQAADVHAAEVRRELPRRAHGEEGHPGGQRRRPHACDREGPAGAPPRLRLEPGADRARCHVPPGRAGPERYVPLAALHRRPLPRPRRR